MEKLLNEDEGNCFIRLEWWRKRQGVSCLSFEGYAVNSSETLAEATVKVSAEYSEEHLQLNGHNVASDVYKTYLDWTPCSDEKNRAEDRIA